jgi:hypothetical protein
LIITIPSLLIIALFFIYGWVEYYGFLGTFLIIGIPFGSLFLIAEYYIKRKVKREMQEIKRKDDEWLDNYMKDNQR